jgi:hypothetical protein
VCQFTVKFQICRCILQMYVTTFYLASVQLDVGYQYCRNTQLFILFTKYVALTDSLPYWLKTQQASVALRVNFMTIQIGVIIILVYMIQRTLDVKNRTLLKQVMSHNVNTEAHSRNHWCREKHYKYYIFRARVYSLSYPASKAHAPYYIATCNLPKSLILFRIFS